VPPTLEHGQPREDGGISIAATKVSLTAGGVQVKRKILVVDDDATTREFLRAVLEHGGYEVVLAEDGVSGVAKAASEKPDLVITDGLLPKLHGFRVCKAIKELDSPPKVILLTGLYTKPTYRREVTHHYLADDLLTKPVGPADLLACIEKHLGTQKLFEGQGVLESSLSTEKGGGCEQIACEGDQASTRTAPVGAVLSKAELDDMFKGWAIPCW
jgi:DNA-binding response OmpR family regulator